MCFYWGETYVASVENLKPEQLWAVWSDVSTRHLWDTDTKSVKIDGSFQEGAMLDIELLDGKKIKMTISECVPNKLFADQCKLPLAILSGIHWIEEKDNKLYVCTKIEIKGLLCFFWRKILGEKIFATVPEQTELAVKLAKEINC